MATQWTRDVRRAALQALYQLDARGDDAETQGNIRESLVESPGGEAVQQRGFELALAVWRHRDEPDALVGDIAPDWPTHRQPIIDRSLLRLAVYEMMHGRTPPKVAINEAVELAKEFSTERSPMFINGVLDRIYKANRDAADASTVNAAGEGDVSGS